MDLFQVYFHPNPQNGVKEYPGADHAGLPVCEAFDLGNESIDGFDDLLLPYFESADTLAKVVIAQAATSGLR